MVVMAALKSQPALWILVTVIAASVALIAKRPTICKDLESCQEYHGSIASSTNLHVAWGLSTVLIMEGASLFSTWVGVSGTSAVVPEMKNRCVPSLLLVITFIVLVGQHFTFAFGEEAWYAHVMVNPGHDLHGRPVYTITYLEWLIIVPILLTLAGHCALGRPMHELTRPVVLTNIYIIMSWYALLAEDDTTRWSLITVTFAMYGLASFDMFRWVEAFFEEMSKDTPNRGLRPCLSIGLIALFAAYGVIYLFGITGVLSVRAERWCYLGCDVSAKLAMTAAFVVIRTREYHKVLDGLLSRVSTSNMGLVSILRGSFDYVLPCSVDSAGRCLLPTECIDLEPLSAALGSDLTGSDLGDLLVGFQEQAAFRSYVANTIKQAEQLEEKTATMNVAGSWQTPGAARPPIAQVLHCSLHVKTPDLEEAAKVRCAIHLSVVPQFTWISTGNWQVIAALRLLELPVPEAGACPGSENIKDDVSTVPSSNGQSSDTCQALVASLQDIARLGISQMLQSQKGGTTVISATETVKSGFDAKPPQTIIPQQQQQQQQQQLQLQQQQQQQQLQQQQQQLQQQQQQQLQQQQQQQLAAGGRKHHHTLGVRHKCPSVEEEPEEEDEENDQHSRVSEIVELVSGASFSRETTEDPPAIPWVKEISCESAGTTTSQADSAQSEGDVLAKSGGTVKPAPQGSKPNSSASSSSASGAGKGGRSSSHRSSSTNCSTRVGTKTSQDTSANDAEISSAGRQKQGASKPKVAEATRGPRSDSSGENTNATTNSDSSGRGELHHRRGRHVGHEGKGLDVSSVLSANPSSFAAALAVGLAGASLVATRLGKKSN